MGDLLGAIMSPLGLASLTVVIVCIGAVYYFQVVWKRKKVWHLYPNEMRGIEVTIKGETSYGLTCEKKGGVIRRYMRMGRGYNFPNGVRFLAINGTAYTGEAKTSYINDVGEEVPLRANLSISDALKTLWGAAEYAKMPQLLRDTVEKVQWGITVEAERIDEQAYGLKPLTEDQLKAEQRQTVLKDIANAVKDADKPNLMWIGLGLALGFAITLLAANMGYIPIAGR